MAAPIDLLYQLTARDLTGALWGPMNGFVGFTSTTGANIFTTPNIEDWPAGTIIFIQSAVVTGLPAAARTVERLILVVEDVAGNFLAGVALQNDFPVAVGQDRALNFTGDIALIAGLHNLRGQAGFDALDAAGNRVELDFTGIVVPKGNVTSFSI